LVVLAGRLDCLALSFWPAIMNQGKNLKHCTCQVHVVPSTSQVLVTVVSCDSSNNNLYHQRVSKGNCPDYMRSIDVDEINVTRKEGEEESIFDENGSLKRL
jgi:hypothetical protein